MKILVTGAGGFVGSNLVENLKNIKEGKNKTRPSLTIDEVFAYDKNNSQAELDRFCMDCDFVFHFAGVNRPLEEREFLEGNVGFSSLLLDTLKKHKNTCPIAVSSSVQATLTGRFAGSAYGRSKKAEEDLFFAYEKETGASVYVYRFPNLVGKWARPNYNSAVATFCHNIAHDLSITVNDPTTELELLFIDDLMEELFDALENNPHRQNEEPFFCYAPVTHKKTLGEIVDCLYTFRELPKTLLMPAVAEGSFEKKLFSMYLSYLPIEKMLMDFDNKTDARGSFTELIKTASCGQFSVNISKAGITKGEHWHNSKWELFIVVRGKALISEQRIGIDPQTNLPYEPITFTVSGEQLQAVAMLPGYTHSITNLSDTEDLITLMWANEIFDAQKPDTFYQPIV